MNIDVDTWYGKGSHETLNGLNVFYKRSGNGESLICIHGFPTSSWDYEKLWPALTTHFDVIASDLIGLGRSSKPSTPITVGLQADVIEQLVLSQGIKQAHILAHDLGDTVAQELLSRQYENTSKIKWLSCVFLNGGIFPETHHPRLIQKLLISPLGPLVARMTSERTFNKNLTAIFSRHHPPDQDFLRQSWKLLIENNGISSLPKLIQYMAERRAKRERWVTPLTEKLVPMRLINGIEDPISGLHAANRFDELIPDADIVLLKNSGHYPHMETPDEVLKALLEFHSKL